MVDQLTDENVNEIRTVFKLFDRQEKNNQEITKHEMVMFLNKLGVMPSKTEVDEMFNLFDANGSGKIDFTEFLSLITRHMGDKNKVVQNNEKIEE